MSTNQAPFDDNHVRLALKHAVNREELVEKTLFGYVINDALVTPMLGSDDGERARAELAKLFPGRLIVGVDSTFIAFDGGGISFNRPQSHWLRHRQVARNHTVSSDSKWVLIRW